MCLCGVYRRSNFYPLHSVCSATDWTHTSSQSQKRQNKLVPSPSLSPFRPFFVKSPDNCCLGNLCLPRHSKINLIVELCLTQKPPSLLSPTIHHHQPITFTQWEAGTNKMKDGWSNGWILSFIDHYVLSLSMFCSFVSLHVCGYVFV